MFRMSKSTIVKGWIVDNKKTIGVSKTAQAYMCQLTEISDSVFQFTWEGVTGTIECGKRVKPSTLQFTNN